MSLKLKKGIKQLVAEANAEIETVKAGDALKLKDDPNVVLVDLRDIRELQRDGRVPGAFHAPRGMLEFWVDPESPYYKDILSLIHISEPTRLGMISYAVFCLKKKKKK